MQNNDFEIGIDIVENDRITKLNPEKILTKNELEEFSEIPNTEQQKKFLASRWAAKEAVIKATDKKYLLKDIEIKKTKTGKPMCNIKGIKLSISHEENYSVAVATYKRED